MDVRIVSHTLTSACGLGVESLSRSLQSRQSALQPNNYADSHLDTWIGRVDGIEEHELPVDLQHLDSRNNRLSDLALNQDGFAQSVAIAIDTLGAARVGVVLGTSTSSVGKTEAGYALLDADDRMPPAYQQADVHNPHAPGHFVAKRLGITGPALTVSTACSSSSKVFAAASRWLDCGIVDAVVVGGVDSLCLSILHGFASLELISPAQCRPFDRRRNGINIGEAAGFALLVRSEQHTGLPDVPLALTGFGESSDAYHMAQPHPDGQGAVTAMAQALHTSGLSCDQIGYVSLHGTATPANDLTETKALAALFKPDTLVSSTKGWTGHTLGAAGITGVIVALESMSRGFVPGTLNLEEPDEALEFPVLRENIEKEYNHAMINSFGFGGNNCSLIFSRVVH